MTCGRQINQLDLSRVLVLHHPHPYFLFPDGGRGQTMIPLPSLSDLGMYPVSKQRNLHFYRAVSIVILASDVFTCFAEIL